MRTAVLHAEIVLRCCSHATQGAMSAIAAVSLHLVCCEDLLQEGADCEGGLWLVSISLQCIDSLHCAECGGKGVQLGDKPLLPA